MAQLSPDDEAFIAKHEGRATSGLSPDDEVFISKALKSLPDADIVVSSTGRTLPDWSVGRQVLDSLTNGQLTRDVPKAARAKAEWEKEHPGDAMILNTVPPAVLGAVLSTAAGRAMMTATEIAGVPALGEFLTGLAGRGIAGARGMLARGGSQAASGSWQGALASSLYPSEDTDTTTNLLRGMGLGAGTNILARIPGAPLRSNITPDVARMAQRYQAEGVPLHTAQVPGASAMARAMSSLLHLGHGDDRALTRRLVASMGGSGERLDNATTELARQDIGRRLDSAAAGVPNMADRALQQDLARIAMSAHNGLQGQDAPYNQMQGTLSQIYTAAQNGHLDGDTYQKLTQKGSALYNALKRDSPIREYAVGTRDALDSALERANPQAAGDIRLARNQWRNTHVLESLENETTGLADPSKVFNLVKKSYEGTGQASIAAARAANPVDIGTLAEGSKRFPSQPGAGPMTYGGLGLAGLGAAAAGEHFGPELAGLAGENPLVAGALGVLGGSYALGGLAQNRPEYLNMLLRSAQRGPSFAGSAAVPFVNQLYRGGKTLSPETAETEAKIRNAFEKRGIDPDIAVRVARSESGLDPTAVGDEGSSHGLFQLHYGDMPGVSKGNAVSGLGDEFTKKTGLDARDPSTLDAQLDFVADHVKKNGWGAFHGWKGDEFAGIGSVPQITVPVPYGGASGAITTSGNQLTGGQ